MSESESKPAASLSRKPGNIYNIPAGADFLGTLANSLLNGELVTGYVPNKNPLILPDATVYVPNRRAARALSTAFLAQFRGKATLLPQIRTLGDTDTNEFGLVSDFDEPALLTEAISPMQRTLELSSLIQTWRDSIAMKTRLLYEDEDLQIPVSPSDSIRLAGDLAALLDQITQEEIDWDVVNKIVPEEYADWWQLTSTFLGIIVENWPAHLAEVGAIDPADRSVRLLKLRAERYKVHGSAGPVIIAGSTGSVPSTRSLLSAVANMHNGAIVFPGIDREMDDLEWARLYDGDLSLDPLIESHSQFGLARTLGSLGVQRSSIIDLANPNRHISDRNSIVGMAMSLSEFSANWIETISDMDKNIISDAFEDVALIEATNERLEALAIAVAIRETLEKKNETCALVTPDRKIAARVSMELKRFGIDTDDSAGTPLADTSAGRFARLTCLVGTGAYSNAELVALLKHPLFRNGLSAEHSEDLAIQFEQVAIRGHIITPAIGGFSQRLEQIRANLEHNARLRHKTFVQDDIKWQALVEWATRIDIAFSHLNELANLDKQQSVSSVFSSLQDLLVELSTDDNGNPGLNSASGADELSKLFSSIILAGENAFSIPVVEISQVLDALLEGKVSRSHNSTHSRVHIFGPLEVRLLDYDRVILAGLNEDIWPKSHRSDAFLNRSMRRILGIPSPERRTGLAAHDFQQLIAKSNVILTRSLRMDKAPTVASRWIQRLTALIGEKQSDQLRTRGNRYIEWAMRLDTPQSYSPRVTPPCEKPPVDVRPTKLPVTDIERWIRDPYALYAKRILKLIPSEPLDREADTLLKGTIYHAIMEEYVESSGPKLKRDERIELLKKLATSKLASENLPDDIKYVWNLRFAEIADAYVDWELDYQASSAAYDSHCEVQGSTLVGETGFTITARADRIDVTDKGEVRVFDYKTGNTPSPKQARGFSPQLSLEAMISEKGGFSNIPKTEVADMRYLRLRTDKPIGGESIPGKDTSARELIDRASRNLQELVEAFQDPGHGYVSRRAPFKDSEMSGDYDHLARVREWSFGEEDNDE